MAMSEFKKGLFIGLGLGVAFGILGLVSRAL
jgi:hypothetical protein